MNIENVRFAVLIATWNGSQFLREQLSSLKSQTVPNLDVWVSDDGSNDGTIDIIETYALEWEKGKFELLHHSRIVGDDITPANGSNGNFRSLIQNRNINAEYYSFCDQDDVWDANKLERAFKWISTQPANVPAIYFTRTRIINSEGVLLGQSPKFNRKPCFANSIVQNIAAGNTIVLNEHAMKILREHNPTVGYVSHDWWCYLLVSAIGGNVKYDDSPSLSYRQHANNLIGENASWRARMTRVGMILAGRFAKWNDRNRRALGEFEDMLPAESAALLKAFDDVRTSRGLSAILKLKKSGVHRQTFFGQLGLYFACAIGKM